jgi:predicted dehydrogenase
MSVPKRLAIVGLGGWATSMHLPACRLIQEAGKACYCGLCDCDEAKARQAAALLGGTAYTDLERMLQAEKPDGLVILVKPDVTPRLIELAIARQLPFLTEKPPSTSIQVHRRLMEAAGALPHVIAYNRRFTPYMGKARAWLQDRPLQTVEATFCRFRRLEADFTGTAVHGIDAVLFLAGGCLAEARLEMVRKDAVRNLFLTAWTRENCRIQLVVAPDSAFTTEEYVVRSTSRNARIEHPWQGRDPGRVCLYEDDRLCQDHSARDFGLAVDDWPTLCGIRAEHENFIDLLEGTQPALATLQDTLHTQIIREAFGDLPSRKARHVVEIPFS